jgi:hypothetical protein
LTRASALRRTLLRTSWSTWLVGSLIALRLVVTVSIIVDVPAFPAPTAVRFTSIANDTGVPYRDVDVEYAPGELLLALAIGGSGVAVTSGLLAVVALCGDLIAFALLRREWGQRVATRYLLLGTPLLVFMFRRSDFVVVALSVVAVVLARRRCPTAGGVAMAAAVLTRLWPVVLLPSLLIERRVRAAVVASLVVVAGGGVWFVVGGTEGIRQVMTYRGANGWELESTVG